jgi:hypothetical protein
MMGDENVNLHKAMHKQSTYVHHLVKLWLSSIDPDLQCMIPILGVTYNQQDGS